MKAQSYLTRMEYVDNKLYVWLRKNVFKYPIEILTFYNKGKSYPYSSDKQRRYGTKRPVKL